MGLTCRQMAVGEVCFVASDGSRQTLQIHYDYALDASGVPYIVDKRYADANGDVIDVSTGTVSVGACCCDEVSVPNGDDIADSTTGWVFPAPLVEVRTFTVSVVGSSDVTVNFGPSVAVVLHAGQSRTWGTGDGAGRLSIIAVTIDTGVASNADIVWEDV